MKAVSSVIAIILILMIVVALAALAYTWFTGIFASLTSKTSTAVTTTTAGMQASFIIESARNSSTTVDFNLRNTGSTDIATGPIAAYVGDAQYNVTNCAPTTLKPNERTTTACRITSVTDPKGKTLKVTIAQGLEQSTTIVG